MEELSGLARGFGEVLELTLPNGLCTLDDRLAGLGESFKVLAMEGGNLSEV